jgi:hypothetical protein
MKSQGGQSLALIVRRQLQVNASRTQSAARTKQRRREMHEAESKETQRKELLRASERVVHSGVAEGSLASAPEHGHRIVCGREHAPAHQRHAIIKT